MVFREKIKNIITLVFSFIAPYFLLSYYKYKHKTNCVTRIHAIYYLLCAKIKYIVPHIPFL